jgi:hypothetical protein
MLHILKEDGRYQINYPQNMLNTTTVSSKSTGRTATFLEPLI